MKTLFLAGIAACVVASNALAVEPKKIASAGGDVTEIIFEMGAGDRVVAADTTSVFPELVNDLPKVGYVRELSAEGVLATGADVLIGSYDMGPPAVMENLEAAGMRVEYVPDGRGAQRYIDKVNYVAGVLGLEDRGAEMIAEYKAQIADIEARRDAMAATPKAMLILAVREGAPIAAGRETTGNDMIEIAGGQNVADYEGWKPMTAEAVIAAAPEIIFLSSIHVERMGGIEAVMDLPSIRATPAGANQSYVVLDSQLMLQFGPRSPKAMAEMLTALEAVAEQSES